MRYWVVGMLLATLLGPAMVRGAESLDTIIIDAGYDKQTRVAVVPFRQGPEFARQQQMSDIVSFDLARSGQFAPLDLENMLSFPTSRAEVFFRDWRVLGVEYLVIGTTSVDAAGDLAVGYELYDVLNERQMLRAQKSASRSQWRDVAHKISD